MSFEGQHIEAPANVKRSLPESSMMTLTATHNVHQQARRAVPPPQAAPRTTIGFAKRAHDFLERAVRESEWRKTADTPSIFSVFESTVLAGLTGSETTLLTHLVTMMNREASNNKNRPAERFIAWPSNDTIAANLNTTKRTVQRAAQRLEERGLIMRHYNSRNERIGYDLTGFISQVEHFLDARDDRLEQRRKARSDAATLELPLDGIPLDHQVSRRATGQRETAADTPAIPAPASVPTTQSVHAGEPRQFANKHLTSSLYLLEGLPSISELSLAAGDADPAETDPDRIAAKAMVRINKMMTCKNGRPTQPWAAALEMFNPIKATSLYYVCVLDPERRKAPAAYFAWMMKHAGSTKGLTNIAQACLRVHETIRLPKPPHINPANQLACRPLRDPASLFKPDPNHARPSKLNHVQLCYDVSNAEQRLYHCLRTAVPSPIATQMMVNGRAIIGKSAVIIQTVSAFCATYLENNFKERFTAIAHEFLGRDVDLIVRCYDDTDPDFPRLERPEPDPRQPKFDPSKAPGAGFRSDLVGPATRRPEWADSKAGSAIARTKGRQSEGAEPGQLIIGGLPLDLPVAGSKFAPRGPKTAELHPLPVSAPVADKNAPQLLDEDVRQSIIDALADADAAEKLGEAVFEINRHEIFVRFTTRERALAFGHDERLGDAIAKVMGSNAIMMIGWI